MVTCHLLRTAHVALNILLQFYSVQLVVFNSLCIDMHSNHNKDRPFSIGVLNVIKVGVIFIVSVWLMVLNFPWKSIYICWVCLVFERISSSISNEQQSSLDGSDFRHKFNLPWKQNHIQAFEFIFSLFLK